MPIEGSKEHSKTMVESRGPGVRGIDDQSLSPISWTTLSESLNFFRLHFSPMQHRYTNSSTFSMGYVMNETMYINCKA